MTYFSIAFMINMWFTKFNMTLLWTVFNATLFFTFMISHTNMFIMNNTDWISANLLAIFKITFFITIMRCGIAKMIY